MRTDDRRQRTAKFEIRSTKSEINSNDQSPKFKTKIATEDKENKWWAKDHPTGYEFAIFLHTCSSGHCGF